jgi:dihydrofolate synthase/folylpolyglutamate synthase
MEFVHNPQNKPHAIHVAGTSGKTSTSYYIASLLKQAGKRVGLMTSPHIEGLNERVQIDLVPLSEAEFCQELSIFMDLVEQSGITLTYAEILYGFAFWEFVRQRVDYIVVEVGMGGLLDATNVIDREDKIAVITDIGLDHTNMLGDTLPEITSHKAGIIKLHNHVFMHRQADEIIQVVQDVSKRKQADLTIIEHELEAPAFLPRYQKRNFSLALEVAGGVFGRPLDEVLSHAQITEAAGIHIPGRMETFNIRRKQIVLDNAHNPQKLRAFRQTLDEQFPGRSIALMMALVDAGGRKTNELTEAIVPIADHVIATTVPRGNHERTSRDPAEIKVVCDRHRVVCEVISDAEEALQMLLDRPEEILVITGSTYLLEGLRPLVRRLTL